MVTILMLKMIIPIKMNIILKRKDNEEERSHDNSFPSQPIKKRVQKSSFTKRQINLSFSEKTSTNAKFVSKSKPII